VTEPIPATVAQPTAQPIAQPVAQPVAPAADKPLLRGVSHQFAFFVFLLANAVLFLSVEGTAGRLAVLVYGASACFLFGVSALYHRRRWSERGERLVRHVDHSAIFVLIAGSYSPLFLLLRPEGQRWQPMMVVWLLAALGVLKALLWSHSPGWVTAVLAIGVGWSGASYVLTLSNVMGSAALTLIVAAGIVYTVGGLVYAFKRPDPLPKVFGYHEVFHALVVTAGAAYFAHLVLILEVVGAFGA
jgi:hemolysin III